jgi:outer membrane protein assembly factor BamB
MGLATALLLTITAVSWGQVTSRGLIGPESLAPLGLQQAWMTTIEVDPARDRVVDVTQFVSSTQSQTVFEFTFDKQLYTVSERDRDAFNKVLGVEGAQAKIDQLWAQIKLEYATRGLPEPAAPVIERRVIPEITLVATTDRGMVHAIDGNTGKTRWSTSVGKNRYPTTAAGASDKYVAVVNGSTLHVLNAADGSLAWSRPMNGAPGAGPAVSDSLVFVPRINGALEIYNVDDPRRPTATYKAFGRTMVQPVLSYNSVAWPTDEGHLYVGFARQPSMRFRIEAKDGIVSKPCFSPQGKLFATSLDGYLYCIDEVRGDLTWRFTTGEPIDSSPVVIGDVVYVVTREHNLFAVNISDATEKWVVPGVGSFLSGTDSRLYVTDVTGNMLTLDAASGTLLGSLPTAGMTMKLSNLQTDRIFLGQNTGFLQCLRQTNLKYPDVHYFAEPAKRPVVPGAAPPPAGAAPVPGAPAVDPFADPNAPRPGAPAVDPFADPGAAPAPMPGAPAVDPFADPGAAPAPMPAPGAAPVDPFG